MRSYVSLALVASLILLLGCSKCQHLPTAVLKKTHNNSSSESKQSTEQSSEKKETTKTHTFVNKILGITSTLVYTVEGDNVTSKPPVNARS